MRGRERGRGYPLEIGGVVPDIESTIDLGELKSVHGVVLPDTAAAAIRRAAQAYWQDVHFTILAPRSNDVRHRLREVQRAATALSECLGSGDAVSEAAINELELENHTGPKPLLDLEAVRRAARRLASTADRCLVRLVDKPGGRPRDYGLPRLVLTVEAVLADHSIKPTLTKDPVDNSYRGTLHYVVSRLLSAIANCAKAEYASAYHGDARGGDEPSQKAQRTTRTARQLFEHFTRERSNSSLGSAIGRARQQNRHL